MKRCIQYDISRLTYIIITIRFDISKFIDIKPDVVHVGRIHCYCK